MVLWLVRIGRDLSRFHALTGECSQCADLVPADEASVSTGALPESKQQALDTFASSSWRRPRRSMLAVA